MKILVVGGGGREHAIIWKIKQSPLVDKIYCAPGNAGISELAECVPIGVMEFNKLIDFVKENNIDYTIIGMDDPLARQGPPPAPGSWWGPRSTSSSPPASPAG